MENVTLEKLHSDMRVLMRELAEIKLIIEENYELEDDLISEIKSSRKRSRKDFISHEEMKKEFND